MAIDPNLITTVRVGELPPLPLENDSKMAHEIGDTLYRFTLKELVNFVRSQSVSQPYEIKYIRVPNSQYIVDNFEMAVGGTQGLGKSGGIWEGWAICNGNNGTDNLDGQTLIGYGANYNTVGSFVGSADAVVVKHSHTLFFSEYATGLSANPGYDGGNNNYTVNQEKTTSIVGESGVGKNIQPSMTILMIMKLP